MTEPTHPGPGQDPLVDEVADVLFDWSGAKPNCDWENHQRAAVVLAHLTRRGLLKGAKTPPTFRELTPAARIWFVFTMLTLLGMAAVALGLLAWAAVAVRGQVLT